MKCEDCGLDKPDTVMRPCPYAEEIEQDETLHTLCDSCSELRAQDI